MEIALTKEYVEVKVQLNTYSLDVLHKCFYWYDDQFAVEIEAEAEKVGIVKLYPKKLILNENKFSELINQIRTDLVDFKTRDIVTKETKNVRDLLIAKAFAHSDEFDAQPTGEVSDPVGFDPSL